MRRFLLSAAAAALVAPAAAFAAESAPAAKTETTAAAEATATLHLAADEVSAKDLIGEQIYGSDGKQIATVDDVVIGADGKADTLVFKSGDFFGLGGKRGALDYGSADITVDAKAEPRVRVSMTKEAIQSVAAYETNEMNDYNLASELIGASADLMSSDDKATITDLILASDGSVNHVIVQNGVLGAIGGEPVAIGYDKVAIEQGDGGVVIGLTPEMLSAAQPFTYETVIETTVESADAPSQP
ncbi:MAG TPA: PRC-barrel domain-containing protein [Amphiplicatus sp.]|nr:PRC-barrel domain-containing protein [Amphiplicatus sp.]